MIRVKTTLKHTFSKITRLWRVTIWILKRSRRRPDGYQADMTRFLREMISHPSESCEEREVVHCIKAEMEQSGL